MSRHHRIHAFSLVELLVVIAILTVLMGMILPAIQRTRESANRLQCSSNMRQVGIAIHNFHDSYGSLPGFKNSWSVGSQLLQFLEQSQIASQLDINSSSPFANQAAYSRVDVLLCPSDQGAKYASASPVAPVLAMAPLKDGDGDKDPPPVVITANGYGSYMTSAGSVYDPSGVESKVVLSEEELAAFDASLLPPTYWFEGPVLHIIAPAGYVNGAFPQASNGGDYLAQYTGDKSLGTPKMDKLTLSQSFPAGVSNTLFLGETPGNGKPWAEATKTFGTTFFDYGINTEAGFAPIHGKIGGNFLKGDCSVEFLARPDSNVLRRLSTRAND